MAENNDSLIIQCTDVHKWFDEFHALRGVDMDVRKGRGNRHLWTFWLGKSTFIRTINRLEEHQLGTIIVDGIELTHDVRNISGRFQ